MCVTFTAKGWLTGPPFLSLSFEYFWQDEMQALSILGPVAGMDGQVQACGGQVFCIRGKAERRNAAYAAMIDGGLQAGLSNPFALMARAAQRGLQDECGRWFRGWRGAGPDAA